MELPAEVESKLKQREDARLATQREQTDDEKAKNEQLKNFRDEFGLRTKGILVYLIPAVEDELNNLQAGQGI